MKKYTINHEWLLEGADAKTWRVGISDYAQEQLGDVVTVELPATGTAVEQGAACAVIESVKAASDVYAPITGTVVAVNEELDERPELVNESAEDGGWLFEIQADDDPDLSDLMDAEGYSKHVAD